MQIGVANYECFTLTFKLSATKYQPPFAFPLFGRCYLCYSIVTYKGNLKVTCNKDIVLLN